MKKKKSSLKPILILLIVVNIIFIFLQIHKQSYIVKTYYQRQRLTKETDQLIEQKNLFKQKLYELQNPSSVSNYATQKLAMQKTKINQIKKIKIDDR